MLVLGIDYGRAKMGVALASTPIAEAYRVIKVNSMEEAVINVGNVAKKLKVEKIIIGLSEGEMARETRIFGKKLELFTKIKVEFQDETLTSYDAKIKSIEAGSKRKKRKNLEHAYSATLILQSYLDSI